MVQQLYTEQQLQQMGIKELREVCDRLSIPRRRSKSDCIADILVAQPQLIKPIEQQPKTCTDCPHFKAHDDGTDKGWCCLFDRFAREPHAMTQDCINSSDEQVVDDYLFHDEQPIKLPTIGDTHFVGDFLLRCSQVAGEYAAVWEVFDGSVPMGEIKMNWQCFWVHTMSLEVFATPQEAVVDLHASLQVCQEEQQQPQTAEKMKITKKDIAILSGEVEVSLVELREIRITQDLKLAVIKEIMGRCHKEILCINAVGFPFFPRSGVSQFFFVPNQNEALEKINALKAIGVKAFYATVKRHGHSHVFVVIPCRKAVCSTAGWDSGLNGMFGHLFYEAN